MRRTVFGYQKLDPEVKIFKTKDIYSSSEISALNVFVKSLRAAGLYSKIKVLYPMLGGTNSSIRKDLVSINSNKFNLAMPTSTTSWNYINGLQRVVNNSEQCVTNFNPSVDQTLGDEGYTVAVGSNVNEITTDPIVLGVYGGPTFSSLILTTPTNISVRLNGNIISTANNSTRIGVYSMNRNGNSASIHKNSGLLTTTSTNGTLPNFPMALAGSYGYLNGHSAQRIQTVVFHKGLNDAETTALHNIISTFENALGRKTW